MCSRQLLNISHGVGFAGMCYFSLASGAVDNRNGWLAFTFYSRVLNSGEHLEISQNARRYRCFRVLAL
jgi:hypothetical protein